MNRVFVQFTTDYDAVIHVDVERIALVGAARAEGHSFISLSQMHGDASHVLKHTVEEVFELMQLATSPPLKPAHSFVTAATSPDRCACGAPREGHP